MFVGVGFMLLLTAWLGWTAAINIPFMQGGLPPAEAQAWPMAVFLTCVGFGASTLYDLMRGTNWRLHAALLLVLLTGGLALRLTILPLLPTLPPLSLVGLREGLAILTVIYAAYAAWVWRRINAQTP